MAYELIVVCPQQEWTGEVGDTLRAIFTAPIHGILGATSMTGLSNIDIYPLTVAFLVLLGAHILCSLHYEKSSCPLLL